MAKPKEPQNAPKNPKSVEERKKTLELEMLNEALEKEKQVLEGFLEALVPNPFLAKIGDVIQDIFSRAEQLQKKEGVRTSQEHAELKNTQWLYRKISKEKELKYWQLLQLFYKFPNDLQIALDANVIPYLEQNAFFQPIQKYLSIQKYVTNGWSLKRFLTDCIALARLRRLQLKYMKDTSPGQSPAEKVALLEKEFSLIPDNFLLERRLGGHGGVEIFKGMEIAKNVPIVIKYLTQQTNGEESSAFRNMDYQEAKKRFEREAKAFDKLERHRKAKEQAVMMLTEQAKKQIEQGKKTGNPEKLKAGFALMKQGEELACDRYFVKAYCLATGYLHHFQTQEGAFERTPGEHVAFMVMEYVEGVNLETLIQEYSNKKMHMPLKVFILILEGILRALDYCHTEGIIHRDIRPDNILITRDFKVRLTNLGRAKVEDMTQLTAQGVFVGTPGYAAPEGIIHGTQYAKDFSDLVTATDHRFDIYSLGCVAYEMLTGVAPFTSNKKTLQERDWEILEKHLTEQPQSISHFRKDIPETMALIVMKMLAKKPENRFPSAREALSLLKASVSMSHKAGEYTKKFVEKLKPTSQESLFPEKKDSLWQKFGWTLLILCLLSLPFLYAYRQEVWPKAKELSQKAYQKVRYETLNLFRQDKKERQEAETILLGLQKVEKNLTEKLEKNEKLLEILMSQFSPEAGYPSVDQSIPALLERSQKDLNQLRGALSQCMETLVSQGGKAALEQLEKYQREHADAAENALLERIQKKLQATYSLAQSLKKDREAEAALRKEIRAWRSALFACEERLELIQEKRTILDENYPVGLRFPGVAPETLKNLGQKQKEAKEWRESLPRVQEALVQNKLAEVEKIFLPHRNFRKTLDELVDIDESILQVLHICKKMKGQREVKQTIDQALWALDNHIRSLQENALATQKLLEESSRYNFTEAEPKELLTQVQQEIKDWKETQKNLNQMLDQNQEQKALQLAQTYTEKKEPETLLSLKKWVDERQSRISIAKATAAAQKQKSEALYWQNKIGPLLIVHQGCLSEMTESYGLWENTLKSLEQNFPEEYTVLTEKEKIISQGQKMQVWLTKTLSQSQAEMEQKNFEKAYDLLAQGKDKIASIQKYVASLASHAKKMQALKSQAALKKEQKMLEARCQRILQKIQKHVSWMEEQIHPVEREIAALEQEFPPAKQYPTISTQSEKILAQAQSSLAFYRSEIQKSQTFLQKQNTAAAIKILEPYEGERLSLYSQFSTQWKELQDDIVQTRQKALKSKGDIEKRSEVQTYLTELTVRKQELEATRNDLNQKLTLLSRYSAAGYEKEDPNIRKYIGESEKETSHLETVLRQGKGLMENGKYAQAIFVLQAYSAKDNPGMTLLPLLQTYLRQCDTLLATNQQLAADPALQQKKIEEERAKNALEDQRRQWQKSPGAWYDRLLATIEEYFRLENGIAKSLTGQGSFLVHSRIKTEMMKAKEAPELMAELRETEESLVRHGISLPKNAENRKDAELVEYLYRNRCIAIDVDGELAALAQAMQKIAQDVRSDWVEEESLRNLLRNLQTLLRKFDEKHENIKSRLMSLAMK